MGPFARDNGRAMVMFITGIVGLGMTTFIRFKGRRLRVARDARREGVTETRLKPRFNVESSEKRTIMVKAADRTSKNGERNERR